MTRVHPAELANRVKGVLQQSVSQQLVCLTEDFLSDHELPLVPLSSIPPFLSTTSDPEDNTFTSIVPDNTPSTSTLSQQQQGQQLSLQQQTAAYAEKNLSSGSATDLFFDPSDLADPMDVPSQNQTGAMPVGDVRMQEGCTTAGTGAGAGPGPRSDRRKDIVETFMTSSPVCLEKDMTLLDAVKVLLRHNISGAPVVERYPDDSFGFGRLLGVISEEDLLWKEVEATDKGITEQFREPYLWSMMASDNMMMEAVENQALKVLSNTVGLSMSEMSISVSPGTPMSEAASIMLDAKIKRLPVIAPRGGGKLGMTVVGILTRKDMLRHVLGLLEQEDGNRMEAETDPRAAGLAA